MCAALSTLRYHGGLLALQNATFLPDLLACNAACNAQGYHQVFHAQLRALGITIVPLHKTCENGS